MPGCESNGFATKKKSIHADERETDRVKQLRSEWRGRQDGKLSGRRVWFLDEMGVSLALTREYARAPGGRRAIGTVPKNYGESVTFLGAMNSEGIKVALEVRGATDEAVMLAFVEQVF